MDRLQEINKQYIEINKKIDEHNKNIALLYANLSKLNNERIKIGKQYNITKKECEEIEYNDIADVLKFKTEQGAYEFFCRMQGYSGPKTLDPPVKDNKGNVITDWRRIAIECIYAPTSKIHVVNTDDNINVDIKELIQYTEPIKHTMKKGDIIFVENDIGYRNTGKYLYDGKEVVNLSSDMDDYGTIPLWAMDLPMTYFTMPSKALNGEGNGELGIIDHNAFIPIARNKEEVSAWVNKINEAYRKKGDNDYIIIDGKYMILNCDEEYHAEEKNYLYLVQRNYFQNIMREEMPTHSIIHRSFLNARHNEKVLNKKTGIPIHHMYYLY